MNLVCQCVNFCYLWLKIFFCGFDGGFRTLKAFGFRAGGCLIDYIRIYFFLIFFFYFDLFVLKMSIQ